ncbi:hypothetical protein [Actinoplanes derwentensis]|uniref:Uncharacterized protein n=1 Tax=Actinoplanes derwentensis TaxID=113562 RepID=A0A1H2CWL6_9ACTN|nr:hypothetical protein [Actinoplanes derwentensis]GID88362.1 hypothetical protein Ade03nite_72860 [Actinoplanes derwentensis]SDT74709.1 hypothetical protein SAMN04489716_7070 [Actinoplanes derwentensis]
MMAARTAHSGTTLLAVVGIVAALADGVLAAIGATSWQSYRSGALTVEQTGPFMVMGASAAVGAVLALLAMIALLRGGRGLARATLRLTWLRLGAVFIALVAVTLIAGISAAGVFGVTLAVGDALGGFVVTGVAARRTTVGHQPRRT